MTSLFVHPHQHHSVQPGKASNEDADRLEDLGTRDWFGGITDRIRSAKRQFPYHSGYEGILVYQR